MSASVATHLVLGVIATIISRRALQRSKVQQRRAAHQPLKFGGAEEVDRRPRKQHQKAPLEGLRSIEGEHGRCLLHMLVYEVGDAERVTAGCVSGMQ